MAAGPKRGWFHSGRVHHEVPKGTVHLPFKVPVCGTSSVANASTDPLA